MTSGIQNANEVSLESANFTLSIDILLTFWVTLVIALQASQDRYCLTDTITV
jgi:hypothetical protein